VTTSSAAHAYMSIGEVLGQLRAEFPDVTISKIRFLEAEGLVEPQRTSSGYRKFSRDDVGRLRYVLAAQRDHYLPLRVIKAQLEALDRGMTPSTATNPEPQVPARSVEPDGLPDAMDFLPELSELRMSREELLAAAGVEADELGQLESFGLITPRPGGHYDGDALIIVKTAADMSRFGIEPRHLRSFRMTADRELGLVEQVVAPLAGQRNPDARARAAQTARELAALAVRLQASLVRAGLAQLRSG